MVTAVAVVNMIGAIVNNATFIRGSILCPFETRTQSEGLTPWNVTRPCDLKRPAYDAHGKAKASETAFN